MHTGGRCGNRSLLHSKPALYFAQCARRVAQRLLFFKYFKVDGKINLKAAFSHTPN